MFHHSYFKSHNTRIFGNCIYFYNLTKQRVVPEFIVSLNRLVKKFGHKEIELNFENAGYVYAYPITTIVGIMHYFKTEYGINFIIKTGSSFLNQLGIIQQYSVKDGVFDSLNKIWIYNNSDEANIITLKIIKNIRRHLPCAVGVLDTCEWALYEVMDNVIQHSGAKNGFVMASINSKNKILNICVFDYGVGIYNSLLRSCAYKPKNDADAISLAIKEGVTSGSGQGYGLSGLTKIINKNGGGLTIISGKGGLRYDRIKQEVFNFEDIILFNKNNPSTTVNFYLKTDNETSIEDTIGKHYANIELESLENVNEEIVFVIKDQALGTATRSEAEKIRNEIINIHRSTNRFVVIDFWGVAIISSSFADELIAKMIFELGYIQFQYIFKIRNTNSSISSIINMAIEKRGKRND